MVHQQVKRYNVVATYTAGNWVGVEQFNTIGDITISGTGNAVIITGTGLFTTDKTAISYGVYRITTGMQGGLSVFTNNQIQIETNLAVAAGDKMLIEVTVFDLDE